MWYQPSLTRAECEVELRLQSVGSFRVRESSQKGAYALSVKKSVEGEIFNGLILQDSKGELVGFLFVWVRCGLMCVCGCG